VRVYAIVQTISRFAGVVLDPQDSSGGVRLDWADINALSEGRLPREAPVLYDLPIGSYRVPEGTQCVFGSLDPRLRIQGRQALFPDVGLGQVQDCRKLVRINVDGSEPVWTPCRHFASAVKHFLHHANGDEGAHVDVLARSLIEFELYGEAEAFCLRLAEQHDDDVYPYVMLCEVYRRSGRLEQCIETCRRGLDLDPRQRALYIAQAVAHAQLEDMTAARDVARRGLQAFPDEISLQRFL
jgi:tetratricopeptide (TPR) repeat protein